jgi:Holliday junction DNA helicase RuvA
MIGRLKGPVAEKSPAEVVVDVGGVGYQAAISLTTFYSLPDVGAVVDLFVVTNLRENALELFAFADRRERELFKILRSISGIGPRTALQVLSGIEAERLVSVVAAGDAERLIAIPGIGRKTAERMMVELKGRLDSFGGADGGDDESSRDAVLALVSLGYKRKDADAAVVAGKASVGDTSVEALIRASLATLSKGA